MKPLHHVAKILLLNIILLIMIVAHAAAEELPLTVSPELAALVKEGLENNQQLRSQHSRVKALKAEIPTAGAWDDPMFGVALLNVPTDTYSFNQEPMTQKQISLGQKFPWFGKLDLKTQYAVLEAKKAEAKWTMQQLALAKQIISSYYELAFIGRSQAINQELMDKLNQLLQVSESRYAGGKGLQTDVLQSQVELSRLREEQIDLANNRQMAERRLNELLNRPEFQTIPPAAAPAVPEWVMNDQQVGQRALTHNPELLLRHLAVDQAAVGVEMTHKSYYPDFDVRVAYGFREPASNGMERADFLSAGINLNIPIWQGQKQNPRL
ncbi:MAG: TolC family protein [Desulfobacteraceae bacterium]|nr:TolC family protein [Desulfobacteraceae bacterium]